MKILILMPMDERMVYAATGIYKYLPDDKKDITFSIPMFMQYLVTTNTCGDWLHAIFLAQIAAKHFIEQHKDYIIIGNVDANNKFDVVFNFQDIDEDLDYEDKALDKFKEVINNSEEVEAKNFLLSYINNLHLASESKMPLHNCRATAQFLSDVIDSDPHLEQFESQKREAIDKLYDIFGKKVVEEGTKKYEA